MSDAHDDQLENGRADEFHPASADRSVGGNRLAKKLKAYQTRGQWGEDEIRRPNVDDRQKDININGSSLHVEPLKRKRGPYKKRPKPQIDERAVQIQMTESRPPVLQNVTRGCRVCGLIRRSHRGIHVYG
jgi:hypothetical protein